MRRLPAFLLAAAIVCAPACSQPIQARLSAGPATPVTTIAATIDTGSAAASASTTAPPATTAATSTTTVPPGAATLPAGYDAWSATARTQLTAYTSPDPDSTPIAAFRDHNEYGDPQTFRVVEEARGPRGGIWYHVLLPIEPNGVSGWVRMRDVTIEGEDQRLLVDLSQRTMQRFERGVEVGRWRVAIGAPDTPTPTGPSYVWTVWRPEHGSHKTYGAGVLAMSTMSPTLSDWEGGTPRIAIHGTSRPSDIGNAVSHGCVRMLNDDLRPLLASVPLGTPVDVVA